MGINDIGQNVRGCSNSFTSACGANDDGNNLCSTCSDDYCNGIQFPTENRLQCLVCNDESCESNEDSLDYCQYFGDKERCVAVFSQDKKIIERGCSSSLQNQNYCNQNYASCVQCGTNGCNTISSIKSLMCSTCSSSSDINCVTNPTKVPSKYCEKGCFTRLLNNATLERGCVDDLEEVFDCIPDNNCKLCVDFDKCNTENYPSDRRSCITCNSSTSCKESTSRLCANYKQFDKCVTIFSGCKSLLKLINVMVSFIF